MWAEIRVSWLSSNWNPWPKASCWEWYFNYGSPLQEKTNLDFICSYRAYQLSLFATACICSLKFLKDYVV